MASGRHRKPSPVGPSTLNLYTRCSDLPLSRFIRLVVDKDLDALVINPALGYEGNREGVWEKIFSEYFDLIGQDEYNDLIRVSTRITAIQLRIEAIHIALRELRHNKSDAIIKALKDLGYKVKDDGTVDEYLDSLERIGRKAAALGVELKRLEKELEGIREKSNSDGPTHEYFEAVLVELSKHMGYRVDPEITTVLTYTVILKRMRREIRAKSMQAA